jgi:hypothetical protein
MCGARLQVWDADYRIAHPQEVDLLIWLASYPRSGNTLLRMVLENALGYHTCSIYQEHETEDQVELANLFAITPADVLQRAIDADEDPHFLKTHELPAVDTYPAIYIVRDGRDASVSFAHYLIDFVLGKDQNVEVNFRQTLHDVVALKERYGGWSKNVQAWIARPNTAIVRFEDLIVDPIAITCDALQQLSLKPIARRAGVFVDFEALHKSSPQFFREGTVGGWQAEMDDEMECLFWQQHGATMDLLGYPRRPVPRECEASFA